MTAPVTVLYLGGAGRSGSTLLERMLGELPGVVAAGEVVHLVERGLQADQTCACGRPFSECDFWQAVGDKAFGGWNQIDADDWQRRQRLVDRNRYLVGLVLPWAPSFRRRLATHAAVLGQLYEAIAAVAGAAVVVDSSKHPSTALVLRHVPGIDLRVIHLVRDSRGVAYSWTKEVARPEIRGEAELMPRFRPSVAAAWWDFFNIAFHAIRAIGTPSTFLRYEALLDHPRAVIEGLAENAGLTLDDHDLSFIEPTSVELGPSHSVAGNPMRFESGTIQLRADDAWRTRFGGRARVVVTVATAPLLLAYGYLRDAALTAASPSLEVIVATRDRPELLRRAIGSILAQRYGGPITVTIVFDQAQPEPALAVDDPHRAVRVVANERRPGLPGARNTGLTAATADLVAFCDDDDLWLQGKVEAQVNCLAQHPEMEVVTTGLFVEAQGRVTTRVLDRPLITFRDLLRSRVMEAHPSTYLARRDAVIDGIGLVDEDIPGGYGEDWDWLLRAGARRAEVGAVMLPLAKVFWHRSSYFAGRWQDIADSSDYLIDKFPEFRSEPAGLARIEGLKAIALAALGQRAAARRQARVALGHDWRCRRALVALATSTPLVSTDLVMRLVQSTGHGL